MPSILWEIWSLSTVHLNNFIRHVGLFVLAPVHMHDACTYAHIHTCICMHAHTHTHIYICMHPYAHMHTRPFCFCILLLKFFLHEWNLWSWSKEINKLSDSQIICRHLRDSSWDLKGKVAGTLFTGERVFNGGSWIPLDIIFFCWHLMYNNYFFSVDYYKICEYFIFKLSIKV